MAHFSDSRFGLQCVVQLAERDGKRDYVYLQFGHPGEDTRSWSHLALTREEAERLGEQLIAASVKSMERI